VGEVSGGPTVIILARDVDTCMPHSAVRLDVMDQRIERIVDYTHCPWVISAVTTVTVAKA
jgi:RNA polymerase sigma-70 factor (ECF subfamily)